MDSRFYFKNGQVAEDLLGFLVIMEHIDDNTFKYHLGRNDFYNWLYGCIDKDIAENVKKVKSKSKMIEKLKKLL